jgi:hypothetical protein
MTHVEKVCDLVLRWRRGAGECAPSLPGGGAASLTPAFEASSAAVGSVRGVVGPSSGSAKRSERGVGPSPAGSSFTADFERLSFLLAFFRVYVWSATRFSCVPAHKHGVVPWSLHLG